MVLTWCQWGPVHGKPLYLMPLKCEYWRWRLLISNICRHDTGIVDSVEGACQVPDVYFACLGPCCCDFLVSYGCCLIEIKKKRNVKLISSATYTWINTSRKLCPLSTISLSVKKSYLPMLAFVIF